MCAQILFYFIFYFCYFLWRVLKMRMKLVFFFFPHVEEVLKMKWGLFEHEIRAFLYRWSTKNGMGLIFCKKMWVRISVIFIDRAWDGAYFFQKDVSAYISYLHRQSLGGYLHRGGNAIRFFHTSHFFQNVDMENLFLFFILKNQITNPSNINNYDNKILNFYKRSYSRI